MKGKEGKAASRRKKTSRQLKAVLILAVMTCALFVIDGLCHTRISFASGSSRISLSTEVSSWFSEDPASSADLGGASVGGSTLPPDFRNELFDLASYENLQCIPEQGIYGAWSPSSPGELMPELRESLLSKGWQFHESGNEELLSCTKGEGRFCWALIQTSRVADGTSLLVQVQ